MNVPETVTALTFKWTPGYIENSSYIAIINEIFIQKLYFHRFLPAMKSWLLQMNLICLHFMFWIRPGRRLKQRFSHIYIYLMAHFFLLTDRSFICPSRKQKKYKENVPWENLRPMGEPSSHGRTFVPPSFQPLPRSILNGYVDRGAERRFSKI